MRWFLTVIAFASFTMTLQADTFLYVSMAPEKQIQVFKLNAKDGTLTSIEKFAVEGAPGSLVVDPQKRYLFASLRTLDSLASYAIDAPTGKLRHINTILREKGGNAAYVNLDPLRLELYSASYAAGDWWTHPVGADGMLKSNPSGRVPTAKTAHAIVFSPDGNWMFVPHVEANQIYQYRRNPAKTWVSWDKQYGGTANAGPRHLAFHPKLPTAYTSDETGNSITAYSFDSNKAGLRAAQSLSTLPADFKGKNTTAEVKVHPNGKFVWVSNRGHDSLAGFAIDEKGMLKALGQTPTEKTPRSFEIDPDGQYLFGAGEGSGKLAVYRINGASGALTGVHTYDVGKSLTWVMAVKR
jgi:6-phosphogluconolactonase